MALTITEVLNSYTVTTTVSGGTTVNTTTSVSVNAGDLILVGVSWVGTGTLSTPAGWTKLQSSSSGSSRVDIYAKKVVTTAVNTGAFVATTMSNVAAMCVTFRITATSTWEISSSSGLDSTNDKNWDIVSGSIQTSTNDLVWVFSGANTNMSTGAAHDTLTQSGATFAAFDPYTIGHPQAVQAGGTIAAAWSLFSSTGGNGTGALTYHFDYTFVNAQGFTGLVRIRENKTPPYVTDPVTQTTLTMYGLESREAFGNPYVSFHDSHIYPVGIPSAEAFGNFAFQLPVIPVIPCECPDPTDIILPDLVTVTPPDISRDIYVDTTTDNLALTPDGDLALVGGVESIAQAVRQRLRTYLEEWFLNIEAGVPWSTDILGVKNLNLATVRSLLRDQINDIAGVLEITQLDVTLNSQTRALSVVMRCTSDVGEFVEQLTLGATENV